MSYWFDKKNTKERCTKPYQGHWTKENVGYARVEQNTQWKIDLLNKEKTLSNLYSYLINMLMYVRCNDSKTMKISEEDLLFLCEIANQEIELDLSKVER